MSKFSAGSGMFYPGFSETEKVRVVRVDKVRYRSRMNRLENRSDIESTDGKLTGPGLVRCRQREEEEVGDRACDSEA